MAKLRRVRLAVILTVCALVATACLVPYRNATLAYTEQLDVVYGQGLVNGGGSSTDLELDLYIPTTPAGEDTPLIILIHGGGFTSGDKASMAGVGRAFAQRGWLAASINYRLAGDNPVASARVQPLWDLIGGASAPAVARALVAAVDDTLTALDFLQARDDVVVPWTVLYGSSAGAVTALITGYALDDHGIERPPVRGVVDLWGGFYGVNVGNPFDLAPGPQEPVLYVAHGTSDPTVPYSFTQQIIDWIAEVGGPPNRIRSRTGAGHGWNVLTTTVSPGLTYYDDIVDFLQDEMFAGLPEGPLTIP